MKILLVQSPTGRREVPIYPIGLAYIAGQLDKHELKGIDLSIDADYPELLQRTIESFHPDIVAVSLRNIDDSSYPVTYSYVKPFSEIIKVLESWDGIVIAGGTGFSIYPLIILERFPRIDYGVPGEGEIVFPELIEYIDNGSKVPQWNGGRLLPRKQVEQSSLAPPDYYLINVGDYPVPDAIGIQSRRGCAFNCSYCTYSFLSGSSFRERPVMQVIADMRRLESMGVKRFQFVDSVFNAPEEYFEELLEAIEKARCGIEWSAWVDEKITPDQLQRMKTAGAVKVDFSPDAITDRGLKQLAKRGKASELLPAVAAAREAGLQVGINFFNGNPGEGFLALVRKFWFMIVVRLRFGWKSTFVNLGTIRVYAHSPLAAQMKSRGIVPENCDFYDPVFWRRRGPGDWLYRLYQRARRIRHG